MANNNKMLVISDIHGYNTWKQIVDIEQPNEIVFLGDYFDTFANITPQEQVDNFNDILSLKETYGDKCIICLGNHDYSYMSNSHCSGYNMMTQSILKTKLKNLYDDGVLVPFHIIDNIIFSHAGVTNTWIKEVCLDTPENMLKPISDKNISQNIYFYLKHNVLYGYDGYGNTISQSPIWVRPKSLLMDKVDGYIQVVGHTPHKEVTHIDGVWFCDAMPRSYLVIENGEFNVKSYE